MHALFVRLGALSALAAVALGAFGAHALSGRLDAHLTGVWQTAVHYHLAHALGLVLVGLLFAMLPRSTSLRWSGWLMLGGTLLFSGSLYLLALTGQRWLGMVTPFGGTAFLGAWLLLAAAARPQPSPPG